jgi:predicted nucleotidyltransferase
MVYIAQDEKEQTIRRLKGLLSKRKEVLFAYLHGSFLEQSEFNDIDIALYLDEKFIMQIDPIDYEISLSLLSEKEIGLGVDVKILNLAPLCFKYHASCGRLLFSRNELKREEFLCRVWSEYFDFQPIAKIYLKEALNAPV